MMFARKTEARRRILPGSSTIEAALLMGIILPVLIAVMMAGFYLHDCAVLEGAASEMAAMGGNLMLYSDGSSRIDTAIKELTGKGTIWTKNLQASASSSPGLVSAGCSGQFNMPGISGEYLTGGVRNIQVKKERKIYAPASLIWKVRGMKELADTIA